MFKEQMNKIKSLFAKEKEGVGDVKKDKRKIENLVAFLVILIITLIAINMILKEENNNSNNESTTSQYKELAENSDLQNDSNPSNNELEEKLQNILESIVGVRKGKCTNYIFTNKRSCCHV